MGELESSGFRGKLLFPLGAAIGSMAIISGCAHTSEKNYPQPPTVESTATSQPIEKQKASSVDEIIEEMKSVFNTNEKPIPLELCKEELIKDEITTSYMLSNIPGASPISWTNGYGLAASELQKIYDATLNLGFQNIIDDLEKRTMADLQEAGVYTDSLIGEWEYNWLNKDNPHYNPDSCQLQP